MAYAPDAGHSDALSLGRDDKRIAAISSLLLLIGMPFAWLSDNPSTGDVVAFIVAVLINLALMALLFTRLVPRWRAAPRTARTALIVGIVAFLLCLVFWTGLSIPVGAAAIALGLAARTGDDRGPATAAVALGAFAVVASFVVLLVG
jgi:hypothetical protein